MNIWTSRKFSPPRFGDQLQNCVWEAQKQPAKLKVQDRRLGAFKARETIVCIIDGQNAPLAQNREDQFVRYLRTNKKEPRIDKLPNCHRASSEAADFAG